jgi:hypothetical protein
VTKPFLVVPIVEGQGEVAALPVLLRRLTLRIDGDRWADVRTPIRVGRGSIIKAGGLERYVDLASRTALGGGSVLLVLDADDDCPATLGPVLLARAQAVRPDVPKAVVLANREYEAWFLASATSLQGVRGLPQDLEAPPDPEGIRDAKGWLKQRRTDGLSYSPSIDQPAISAVFDLEAARSGSASFDKLWRDVERLMTETLPTGTA